MSRSGSAKASGRRKQGSGRHSSGSPRTPVQEDPTIRNTPVDVVDPVAAEGSAVLADHPLLAVMARCGDCGGPVRWMLPEELREVDPQAYRDVAAGLSSDVLDRADVWLCPQCGAAGMQVDDEGDPWDEEDLDAVDLDDRCTDCGTEVEWYDPAHVATIDKDAYMQAKRAFGAADLLDGDAAICPGCGRITFFPWDDFGD